jgi:YVTN family beta-propeller protein
VKSAPISKIWTSIFCLIGANSSGGFPAFGQEENVETAEVYYGKLRAGWTLRRQALGVCCALLLLGWPMCAFSQTAVATVGVGTRPQVAAVNPVTNKIYVANQGSNTVTAIDGATNTTTTVAVGGSPLSVAVNPVTNKIYVANQGGSTVTVIDGATNTTTTVAAGTSPYSVAVNPVTNKIYVANVNSSSVTVIDGASDTTTTVAAGSEPWSLAVNPETNKIYVANEGSGNVTVIDGTSNTTTTVMAGSNPFALAVNPVTNKIYVANTSSNNVTVIDGASNTTTTVAAGSAPQSLAVNPVTNTIYVANAGSNNVTVIDGATNTTTTVVAGSAPFGVGVNPVTNKIYVPNYGGYNVMVIDGATNTTTTVVAGTSPYSVAVNPVTNKIYVPNYGSNNVTVIDGATNNTTTAAVGSGPESVAVNPVTNKIYVANEGSDNVTVIDGAADTTTTVTVGSYPYAAAVNPVTNKIYLANLNSNTVTVIDGATNTTTTVAAGTIPRAIAVNPVTNKIYVINYDSSNVTVIDGPTNTTITVATGSGSYPVAVAVNPVTNKIYVTILGSTNSLAVVDGATNTTTTVAVGSGPESVAVNAVTNRIYVTNVSSSDVTVIDGATNATTTVAAGMDPEGVAVNAATNTIYVANAGSNNVTVIDGATNTTTTVAVGTGPNAVAVNAVTNKIYVTNVSSNNVTVIDGATNTVATTVAAGASPFAAAVNPVTNQIYVANADSNNVTVLTEQKVQSIPLTTVISTLPNNQTANATPSFTFSASSTFLPTMTNVDAVYFQVDTWQGPWTLANATMTPGTFTGTLPTLTLGVHILYAFATDGQDATSIMTTPFGGSSPVIGNIVSYIFLVTANQPPTITSANLTTFQGGVAGSFTVTTTGSPTPSISESGVLPSGVVFQDNGDGTGTVSGMPNAGGTFPIAFTAQNGVSPNATQNFTLTVNQLGQTITFTINAPASAAYNSSFTVTAAASSGLAVVYTSTGACTNAGATYTMTSGTGTCTVIVNQPGNSSYSAAPQATQTVTTTMNGSSTTLASLNSSIYPNQTTTLSATVSGSGSAPAGTVTFYLGVNPIGTSGLSPVDAMDSAATLPLSGSQLALGANSLTAIYSGGVDFGGSSSSTINVPLLSPVVNFGSNAVGTRTSQTLTYGFTSNTTLTAVDVLTGGTPGLDYSNSGGNCAPGSYTAGQSCTLTVALTPAAPGERAGAVTLFASGSNLPLMTWYLSAIGQSGEITVEPGMQTTVNLTGTLTPAGYGVVVDGAGNVYVVDHANNAVLKLTAPTFTQSTVASGLSGPSGVAVDGAGNLYVANGSSVLMIPNENGTLSSADESTLNITGLGSARGIAVDGSGDVYVSDATNSQVLEFSSGGVTSTITSGLATAPHGVAVDAGGNVYVATTVVTEYPFGGGPPIPIGSGYNNPRGVAVDAAGAVYVADIGNNQVVRVSPGGSPQATLSISGVSAPQGVALDSADNVYVTDPSVVYQMNRTQGAPLSFPTTNVGSTSAAQTLTVSDAGNEALQFSNLAVSANFIQQPSGGTDCTGSSGLSSGGQCLIAAAFQPTVSGTLTGIVTINDNVLNGSGTSTVQLSGGSSQVAQTIMFVTNAPASAAYNMSFTVAATASSGLGVVYSSSGSCSNSGATYTITSGNGTCTLIANQPGNAQYSAAPQMTQSTAATMVSQTITFTINAPTRAAYNSNFTVAATASSGLGVVYSSSGSCTNAGATYTMINSTGTCIVIANQPGNNNYSAAFQATQSVNAVMATQTITFTTNAPAYASYQSSFTVAATTSSSLPIVYSSSGPCTNAGATYTMTSSTGKCTVVANQPGNNNYLAAPQVKQSATASKAAPTVTFTGAPAHAPYQSIFTLTATTNASTTATITASGTCSISGTTVTMTKGTGSCTLTAKWAADSDYVAVSRIQTTIAERLVPNIVWATPAPISYGTPLSSSELDAAAISNNAPLTGNLVYIPASGKILIAGSQNLSVSFAPTDITDYTTAIGSVTLTVDRISTTTFITSATPNPSIAGKGKVAVDFNVTAVYGKPTGSVTVNSSTGEACTGVLAGGKGSCSLTFTSSGSRTLIATYSGDDNDIISMSSDYMQNVNP